MARNNWSVIYKVWWNCIWCHQTKIQPMIRAGYKSGTSACKFTPLTMDPCHLLSGGGERDIEEKGNREGGLAKGFQMVLFGSSCISNQYLSEYFTVFKWLNPVIIWLLITSSFNSIRRNCSWANIKTTLVFRKLF